MEKTSKIPKTESDVIYRKLKSGSSGGETPTWGYSFFVFNL